MCIRDRCKGHLEGAAGSAVQGDRFAGPWDNGAVVIVTDRDCPIPGRAFPGVVAGLHRIAAQACLIADYIAQEDPMGGGDTDGIIGIPAQGDIPIEAAARLGAAEGKVDHAGLEDGEAVVIR